MLHMKYLHKNQWHINASVNILTHVKLGESETNTQTRESFTGLLVGTCVCTCMHTQTHIHTPKYVKFILQGVLKTE